MRRVMLVALVAACDAYDAGDLGPTPFLCGTGEPPCPSGYTCMTDAQSGDMVCVGSGGSVSGGFDCVDDGAVEPNDTLPMATTTPVDGTKTFERDGLAICPAGHKDTFAVTIGT